MRHYRNLHGHALASSLLSRTETSRTSLLSRIETSHTRANHSLFSAQSSSSNIACSYINLSPSSYSTTFNNHTLLQAVANSALPRRHAAVWYVSVSIVIISHLFRKSNQPITSTSRNQQPCPSSSYGKFHHVTPSCNRSICARATGDATQSQYHI